MKKRALMYASVASMIQQFNMGNIRLLLSMGYEVDVACNMLQGSSISAERIAAMEEELKGLGVNTHHIPIPRKITALGDIFRSLKETRRLMNEREYTLVHCHSPIGGMICRIAHRLSRGYKKAKMLYTAHGFHFFKGAPKLNWLLFYPVEKLCSRFTDVLLTINNEDFERASAKFHAKKIVKVHGAGISPEKLANSSVSRTDKRIELGLTDESTVILSVGELNENKNHSLVIDALSALADRDVHYVIVGQGALRETLAEKAKASGLGKKVHLLGFRSDISELYSMADIFVFPSHREGLSVALMEAMANGLPCAVSKIRGNTDLIDDQGGILFAPDDKNDCREAIIRLLEGDRQAFGDYNREKIKPFFIDSVLEEMQGIYAGAEE